MYLPQTVIILVSLAAILLWIWGSRPASDKEGANLAAVVLAVWIVSSAVLGQNFFVLRFAGFFDITIERLFFSVILFLMAAGLFSGKIRFQTNVVMETAMALFILVCVLSMIRTGFLPVSPDFPSPWFVFITGYLFPFIVFLFAKSYIFSEKDISVILHALFFFGVYLCITSFFEYYDIRRFVLPSYISDPELGLHLERARGPFLNAAFNGVGIVVGFICGIHLIQKKSGLSKVLHQASLLIFFPAVFFTLTRSVYLGMLISVGILLVWYKTPFSKWKLISLPLAVTVIFGIINSPRLFSAERREGGVYQVEEVAIRFALIDRSVALFAQQPFAGVGLAQFIPASISRYRGRVSYIAETAGTQYQHNHLLGLAAELGVGGVSLYLLIVFMVFRRLMQLGGKLPRVGLTGNNLRIVIAAVWCVYLSNNFFVEPSNNLFHNSVPFILAGIADGIYTRSLESRPSMPPTFKDSLSHV